MSIIWNIERCQRFGLGNPHEYKEWILNDAEIENYDSLPNLSMNDLSY